MEDDQLSLAKREDDDLDLHLHQPHTKKRACKTAANLEDCLFRPVLLWASPTVDVDVPTDFLCPALESEDRL